MSSEVPENCHRLHLPAPRLPPELIDSIIDHLHDDNASLRACSLVCKTWTRSARSRLFCELEFHGLDVKRLLRSAPAAIPFIRHLRLYDQPWDETLPLLFEFESIRSLTATNLHVHFLGSRALSALFDNFSAAVDVRLDEVRFATTEQLVRFICAFPRLQRLAIRCRSIVRFHSPNINLSTPTTFRLSPHLRVLELNSTCMDQVLDWFLSLPDHPALRAVGLHPVRGNNPEMITKLVWALENSLESFYISTAIVAPGARWQIDLSRNGCLRSIQIHLDTSDHARLVTHILSQISSTHMEEVGLEIWTGDSQLEWNAIDRALQHASFSGLKIVNVRVMPWNQIMLASSDVSWVVAHMPQCHARGILHVREIDWQSSYFLP